MQISKSQSSEQGSSHGNRQEYAAL